jgi:hypothetical protein
MSDSKRFNSYSHPGKLSPIEITSIPDSNDKSNKANNGKSNKETTSTSSDSKKKIKDPDGNKVNIVECKFSSNHHASAKKSSSNETHEGKRTSTPRQEVCRVFIQTSSCKFGNNCRYLHSGDNDNSAHNNNKNRRGKTRENIEKQQIFSKPSQQHELAPELFKFIQLLGRNFDKVPIFIPDTKNKVLWMSCFEAVTSPKFICVVLDIYLKLPDDLVYTPHPEKVLKMLFTFLNNDKSSNSTDSVQKVKCIEITVRERLMRMNSTKQIRDVDKIKNLVYQLLEELNVVFRRIVSNEGIDTLDAMESFKMLFEGLKAYNNLV